MFSPRWTRRLVMAAVVMAILAALIALVPGSTTWWVPAVLILGLGFLGYRYRAYPQSALNQVRSLRSYSQPRSMSLEQTPSRLGLHYTIGVGEDSSEPSDNELRQLESPWKPPAPRGATDHPVAIAQDGLRRYARFLYTGDERFLDQALAAGRLLVELQHQDGAWRYSFPWKELPAGWVSAMAQGEGISLLLRLHQETAEGDLLESARRAYRFMMKPVADGGTLGDFPDGSPVLEEYPLMASSPHTLNGSIFALWGVRDFALVTDDAEAARSFDQLAQSLADHLDDYDTGQWTYYSLAAQSPIRATPRYHSIHVVQARVMAELTGDQRWDDASRRWADYHEAAASMSLLEWAIRDIRERLRA